MKRTFRQSMTWLHTWAGLLLGWVAYAIFVTGTLSYFRPEITRWMRPELAAATSSFDAARAGLLALAESAPDSRRWIVEVPNERSRELKIYWQPTGGRRLQSELLDPNDGAKAQARGTFGGEFFYRFHFQLLLPHPWGRYTAGVVALAMFVALLTGIVAHRRFFADLFLLRTGRVALRSWLDFHNVAGVLTLPFCLMLCYSALVIFNALYLPWPDKVLPSDQTVRVAPVADAAWVAPAPVEPMLDEALRRWGAERSVRRLDLDGRGTAGATVTLTRDDGQPYRSARVTNCSSTGYREC